MKSSAQNQEFSGYGTYDISEKLDLTLPKTEIHIKRKPDNRITYYRKNSENQEITKSIPQSSKTAKIELCPILPLHLPAKKTHDLIFLRLAESIFVEKNSTATIQFQFPIEIGVFVINSGDDSKDLFDCFTCEPMHSRFALYGTPETGNLCMYSKVNLLENDDDDNSSQPYIFAKMKLTLKNKLDRGVFVGKLVFPITHHMIYYGENSSEVHIDDIIGTIKLDTNKEILKIRLEKYSKRGKSWKQVLYSTSKNQTFFVMDKGFD
ncbi:DUF432 domain-containing protein [Nitrosopumilus sp.]|uniref:DUF432 domain-containing protein n=1 Tax=Nitrosopumilus sp. TaxID=2024843 RepID=UPI003B5BC123